MAKLRVLEAHALPASRLGWVSPGPAHTVCRKGLCLGWGCALELRHALTRSTALRPFPPRQEELEVFPTKTGSTFTATLCTRWTHPESRCPRWEGGCVTGFSARRLSNGAPCGHACLPHSGETAWRDDSSTVSSIVGQPFAVSDAAPAPRGPGPTVVRTLQVLVTTV